MVTVELAPAAGKDSVKVPAVLVVEENVSTHIALLCLDSPLGDSFEPPYGCIPKPLRRRLWEIGIRL